jgi:hypothetical protein
MKLAILAFALLFASAAVAGPKVSCVATSNQVVSYDRETKQTTEREEWLVNCSGKGEPMSKSFDTFHEAMQAIEAYRNGCTGNCDKACQDKCFKKGECPYGWKP